MSEKAERILIRGVNWLGDAVMSTPALMRLRDAKPGAHIALLTSAKLVELWQNHPALDEVIPFSKAEGVGQVSKRLRVEGFDQAIIFPNSFRSAFESWMAGIPQRIGFAGSGRRMLLTRVVARRSSDIEMHKRSSAEVRQLVTANPGKPRDRYPASAHHLHNYLHLIAALGANPAPLPPRIPVTPQEIDQLRSRLSIEPNTPVVAINPGAEYGPAKRWPAERFIEAAAHLHQQIPSLWMVTGGAGDAPLADQITAVLQNRTGARVLNLAGKTTLRELCVVLAVCDVVLTNDTGPMHLAAAVGTPVVVPFGSTSPELTGPGLAGDGKHHLVLGQAPCAPCFRRECPIDFRCMLSISSEEIGKRVGAILNHVRRSAP